MELTSPWQRTHVIIQKRTVHALSQVGMYVNEHTSFCQCDRGSGHEI